MALHFIAVGGSGTKPVQGNSSDLSTSDAKLIRSLAMRDFRRRQRLGLQAGGHSDPGESRKGSEHAWRDRRRTKSSGSQKPRSVRRTKFQIPTGKAVVEHDVEELPLASSPAPVWGAEYGGRAHNAESVSRVAHHAHYNYDASQWLEFPSALPSCEQRRLIFTKRCAEAFFPDGACTPLVLDRFLWHCISEKSVCLQICNDAVHYLYCGTSTGDRNMGLEGRKKHLLALSHIRSEIERPSIRLVDLVAPICDLMLCEAYQIVGSGGTAWVAHQDALHAVISQFASRGEHLEGFLFRQVRHSSLMQALAFRTPIGLGTEYWCKRSAPAHGPEALIQLAVRLPALLYAADLACAPGDAASGTVAMVASELMNLETALLAWSPTSAKLQTFGPIKPSHAAHYQRLDLAPDLFTKPARSAAHLVARISSSFHQCLLLELRSSLLDLKAILPKSLETARCITVLVDESAARSRDSVNEMIGMAGSPISRGISVRMQLHSLSRWYTRSRDEEGMRWIEDTERRLQDEMPYIDWQAILPLSCHALLWLVTKP